MLHLINFLCIWLEEVHDISQELIPPLCRTEPTLNMTNYSVPDEYVRHRTICPRWDRQCVWKFKHILGDMWCTEASKPWASISNILVLNVPWKSEVNGAKKHERMFVHERLFVVGGVGWWRTVILWKFDPLLLHILRH